MSQRKRAGLLFGSFNPIHSGHLAIAHHLLKHENLEEIWFVISPLNPLKNSIGLLPEADRLAMLLLAIEEEPRFIACTRELQMPIPSYTHATLDVLRHENPDYDFVLIIGSDNLEVFDQWKEYEKILATTEILVYPRSGTISTVHTNQGIVRITDAPLMEISSTMIREALKAGKETHSLLPCKVNRLIKEKNWYRD